MSTARKIRCTDCGEAVPYGRLSCPSCGTLLASVAGGVRHTPTPAVVASTRIDVKAAAAAPDPGDTADAAPPADGATLRPRPLKPTPPRPAAQRSAAQLTLAPTSVVRSVTAGAGAFIPAAAGATAGSATGGGWAAHVNSGRSTVVEVDLPEADEPASEPESSPGFALPRPSLGLQLDRARLDAGLEWAAALGGGLLAISMLLPWSRSVIGASGIGYFDSWGLAGPGHVLLLVGSLAVLVLAVLPTKVPTWISRGLAPLILGVFALGLTWPYVIGPLGGGIGVILTLIGALVLIVTGVVGDWHTRHAPEDPPV
jgi:hypothetical protein